MRVVHTPYLLLLPLRPVSWELSDSWVSVTYACNCYCHAASITLEKRELPGAFIGQDQISGCISAHYEDLVTCCVQGTGVHCVYCHGLNRLTDHQDGITGQNWELMVPMVTMPCRPPFFVSETIKHFKYSKWPVSWKLASDSFVVDIWHLVRKC